VYGVVLSASKKYMYIAKEVRILSINYNNRESQWCNGSIYIFIARSSGLEPHQEQGFLSSYEAPKYLGQVTLMSFR
jgi:hypothetical protein